jgi:hypothetical protein
MASIARRLRTGATATAVAAAVALGGCADGVEVNSRLLDTVGLSTAALSKREEPRLQQRAPLVMPPTTQKLPVPGSAPPPSPEATTAAAWPKDKDQQRVADAADRDRRQQEYCRDGNWKERAMDSGYGHTNGPERICGSIFSVIGGFFGGSTQKADPMNGGTQ